MAFRVGQKVVCVDASPGFYAKSPCSLREGEVYTIERIDDDPAHLNGAGLYVDGDRVCQWSCKRFRPVVERKTDISIFTKMLTGKRVDA